MRLGGEVFRLLSTGKIQDRRYKLQALPNSEYLVSCIFYLVSAPQLTLTDFRMAPMAFFSSRDTWAWEMPTMDATSIWVFPS